MITTNDGLEDGLISMKDMMVIEHRLSGELNFKACVNEYINREPSRSFELKVSQKWIYGELRLRFGHAIRHNLKVEIDVVKFNGVTFFFGDESALKIFATAKIKMDDLQWLYSLVLFEYLLGSLYAPIVHDGSVLLNSELANELSILLHYKTSPYQIILDAEFDGEIPPCLERPIYVGPEDIENPIAAKPNMGATVQEKAI